MYALAAQWFGTRFPPGTAAWDGRADTASLLPPGTNELTLCPQGLLSVPSVLPAIAAARAAWPHALLRLEAWLALGPLPGLDAPAIAALTGAHEAAQPLFLHAILTHADELTAAVRGQLARLADAGVPLAAEVPLLRGRNDSPDALRQLLRLLEEQRVRPYYLIDAEWLPAPQRVPEPGALELARSLRGWISGLAVPQLVREAPGGARTPWIPAYLTRLDGTGADLTDYRGQSRRYPNPPQDGKRDRS